MLSIATYYFSFSFRGINSKPHNFNELILLTYKNDAAIISCIRKGTSHWL